VILKLFVNLMTQAQVSVFAVPCALGIGALNTPLMAVSKRDVKELNVKQRNLGKQSFHCPFCIAKISLIKTFFKG
jgi:hypothetical protein